MARPLHYLLPVSAAVVGTFATAPTEVQAADTTNIDIPAQPLSSGVLALSEQTDATIMVNGQLLGNIMGRAVKGRMSAERALKEMLRGTPFRVKKGAGGALMIIRGGPGGRGAEQRQGRGALSGRVTDAATQRRLEGARIVVRETGQAAVSDERGEYRFADVPQGDVTLDVTFIGYDAYSETVEIAAGSSNVFDVRLGTPHDIVVYASKSARALALNKEKAAENSSTVISSDLLGNFNGTTISEALRRAPGIAFVQDERTGAGTNIIVRGLAPDYNQVKLNGVALPETTGTGRSANLGNILADSVSEITINKTLLANQDSAGTGGLIEIETKSPLDRPARYVNLSAEYTQRGKGFGQDSLIAGTVSHRFGEAQNFGISASVQYRRQDNSTIGYAALGSIGLYLPLDRFGNPASLDDIDPRTLYPFEEGVDGYYIRNFSTSFDHVRSNTLSINLAAEWQVSEGTNLKVDFLRSRVKSDSFSASDQIGGFAYHALQPVPLLGGETRYVLGDYLRLAGRFQDYRSSRGAKEVTTSYALRGTSKAGAFTFDYKLGHARGATFGGIAENAYLGSNYVSLAPEMYLPSATDPDTGQITTIFGRRTGTGFMLPLLTDVGLSLLDIENAGSLNSGSVTGGARGGSKQYTASGSGRYEFGSPTFKYLEVGFDYNRNRAAAIPGTSIFYYSAGNRELLRPEVLGLAFRDIDVSRVSGGAAATRILTEDSYNSLVTGFPDIAASGALIALPGEANPTAGLEFTKEQELAEFVQGRADIGKLEIIGGVRFSEVRVTSNFGNGVAIYAADGTFDQAYYDASRVIVEGRAKQFTMLPRFAINFRPANDIVVRAGYYTSIARPQVQLLTSTQGIVLDLQPYYGPNGNQPTLNISTGNPDLKPARTHSFDFSAEYYMSDTSVLKAAVFYKRISNLLESNVTALTGLDGISLPDDPRFAPEALPNDIFIVASRPVNNPDAATLWGFEVSAEQQLAFLPGFLSGFGLYANYVFTKSSKRQPLSWFTAPIYDADGNIVAREQVDFVRTGVRFNEQPTHSGTVGLRYSKYGIDGSLLYSYQARRQSGYASFGVDEFIEAADSLDLRLEYRPSFLPAGTRLFLEGNDLLRGPQDFGSALSVGGERGVDKYNTRGTYRGGRSVTFGASVTF